VNKSKNSNGKDLSNSAKQKSVSDISRNYVDDEVTNTPKRNENGKGSRENSE
jgi:hypothetical protein